ncbi:unnamed protein product [Darwinula stevensoni]|uniref:Uncharacterized protein n=1 Tax=Darwinula stevensoni TaxID=69355 RepID=A0A7R8XK32_9CRUS|nr:unnamed protein product [Darwinula stevensoni]CAG0892769.1 unnamed protein product [Darwinula stevensoni]
MMSVRRVLSDRLGLALRKAHLIYVKPLDLFPCSISLSSSQKELPWRIRGGYSIGHVLNDICSSMWFTYLLLYFHRVLGFESVHAGTLLLVGQVADALSTPLVGISVDKETNSFLPFQGYGLKKTWHAFGLSHLRNITKIYLC